MKTVEFDGLYDLTRNFNLPAILERHIFTVAKRLSESDEKPYDGGYWKSEKIGEGWFFNLTSERTWRIVNVENYSDVTVGTKAFSLAVFLVALSEFSIYLDQKGVDGPLCDEIAELHSNAMEFAKSVLSEEDYSAFCAVID
jgi:hypothetical protein